MNGEFIQADDVQFNWAESAVSFDCPCGERSIVMDGESDPKECRCGRVYRVHHCVEVSMKDKDLPL